MSKGKKILFVNPVFEVDLDGCPPSSFLQEVHFAARNVLRQGLHEVTFVDFVTTTPEELQDMVAKKGFDLAVLPAYATQRIYIIDLIKTLKKRSPGTMTMGIGNFFGQFPEKTLERVPEMDFVCSGDAVAVILDFLERWAAGKPHAGIEGLCYRENGVVVSNGKRKPGPLDDYLFIDHDVLGIKYAPLRPMPLWEEDETKRCAPVTTSLGCGNNCAYCSMQFDPYRAASLDTVMHLVREAMDRYGTRNILFCDPSLAFKENRLRELCTRLIDEGLDINWAAEMAPTVSDETLELMRKAGCISLHFALETGAPEIMRQMRPRMNLRHVRDVALKCSELNIRFAYFSLLSFPEEDLEHVWETITFLQDMAGHGGFSGMSPLFVIPGTKLEQIAVSKGIIPADFDWFDPSYRSEYSFVIPHTASMPHYIEKLSEKHINNLTGYVLAVQDFAARNPRVAKLRYSFLLRMFDLQFNMGLCMFKKGHWTQIAKLAKHQWWMLYNFFAWKLRVAVGHSA